MLISAGHEGRPASGHIFRNAIVTLVRKASEPGRRSLPTRRRICARTASSVARLPADFEGTYRVRAAVFIHFDGSDPPCRSTASIGYARRAMLRRLPRGAPLRLVLAVRIPTE